MSMKKIRQDIEAIVKRRKAVQRRFFRLLYANSRPTRFTARKRATDRP